jgi:hypothetical protein
MTLKYITVAGNGIIDKITHLKQLGHQPIRRCLSRIHIPQSFQLRTMYVDVCVHPDLHTLHTKTVSSQKTFNYIGINGHQL